MKSVNRLTALSLMASTSIAAVVWLAACGGDTSGNPQNYDGTSYSDESAGKINLDVIESELDVADTSGFRVHVTDAAGLPVPNIEIACDTETGLALIEPTSGFELTDSNGQMSGRVGCVTPGSYQIGCRIPVGGNKRSFETIRCSGPGPEGFGGFPGAGGGTLGVGGSQTGGAIPSSNTGDTNLTGVTINENGADTLSIDVTQGTCGFADKNGDGDSTDPGDVIDEPFTDTVVKFAVKNTTSGAVNFSSFSYVVSGASGDGTFFESTELALNSGGDVSAGGSASLVALFLKASNGHKVFTGTSASISAETGFRNVTFTLFGTDSAGKSIRVTTTVGLSIGNFNKCASSLSQRHCNNVDEAQLKALIADDGGNPAFIELVEYLRGQGRHAEALNVALRGVNANHEFLEGRLALARVFFETGAVWHAQQELQYVSARVPENQTVQRLIEKLGGAPQAVPSDSKVSSEVKKLAEDTFDFEFLKED